MLNQRFDRLARYNVWANTVFCNYFSTYPESLLEKEVTGSFNSVKNLLLHIWDAEFIWYERLNRNSPHYFPSEAFDGFTEQLFDMVISQSSRLQNSVAQLGEEELSETMTYSAVSGSSYRNNVADILQHVFNHSTYHRGQLVIYARMLGLSSPPSTDFIRFLRTP